MASFKGNGRGDGSKKRPSDPRRRRQGRPDVEPLENRRLLSGGGNTPPAWHPTDTNLLDAKNGPMANLGSDAVKAYSEYLTYEAGGAKGTFTSSLSTSIFFKGTSIGMDLQGYGNFSTYESALTSIGMTITATDPTLELVEGYVPIADLPQVAEQAQTVGGQPNYKPTMYQEGISPNQASTALNVTAAATKFGLTGAGQKIGVLSDSVNEYTAPGATVGGLAASVATGDLPNNVQVLQDLPGGGGDDEGRAMLEEIYDLAPQAGLGFATGDTGEVGMASNITALQAAGYQNIVDDIGYPTEPSFQDGVIQQAINQVVATGGEYSSSAGNESDSGYMSQFRAVSATVGSLGAGTYMNFDPTGATTTTELGINVYTASTGIVMQFNQPFYTTNGVTSNLELDVLNAAGTVVATANMNNVATQEPYQIIDDDGTLAAGQYFVVIKVDSGPAPSEVKFYATGDDGFSVDTKFGSAGGTYYPSTNGHNSGASTISVGAAPFWATPNYVKTPDINVNEPFSSTGPVESFFSPTGTALSTPVLLQKPDVSGVDGVNTSFFIPNNINNTTQVNFPANPPYPGDAVTTFSNPTTPTNDLANLPNFTGTSAASPNIAAIVALMREANSTLTHAEIVQDLISTTTPLDGVAQGAWGVQSGYGLVNALAAVSAAEQLAVTFISPGANQTVTATPNSIVVTFNQPVLFSTVTASDLKVTGPNGATVTVGTPTAVGGGPDPTQISFPITITPAAGKVANGTYFDQILAGDGITSESGNPLTASVSDQFNLDVTNGPKVASTSFVGRIVQITFNEPVNPATITSSNVYLFRDNGVNNPNFNPNGIIVSQLPGVTMSYNANTYTVTIDLTGVPQSSLPTDHYGLVVTNAVTDSIGVPLNGTFNGVFPSGTNPEASGGSIFFQDLGVVAVQAPIITYLGLTSASDSGTQGDYNTNDTTPSIFGQVAATFPGTVSGILIYAQFNGISHAGVATGGFNLGVGSGGRGYVGTYDVETTTNALGQFTINYPAGVTPLPNGLNQLKVVAVGQPDSPPFAGLSSSQTVQFRIDTTQPYVGVVGGGQATSIPENANINSLTSLTLDILDPVSPQSLASPFAVSPNFAVPALNPVIADNVSNYKLFLVNGTTLTDESSFIASATFTSTSARVLATDPYTGTVTLTFAPGLPEGQYKFLALSSAYGKGLTDAAGNAFAGYANEPAAGGSQNYELDFTLQPTATYLTSFQALTTDTGSSTGYDVTGVRSVYEIPAAGVSQTVEAPPSEFKLDFSNSLDPTANYTNKVELVRSANTTTSGPDGEFGDLGITNTTGFTVLTGITVTLQNSVPGAVAGQYGYDNELLLTLPAGFSLPADDYRLYIPNTSTNPIDDIFGNQLDGEFLGYQNAQGKWVDQLPNGTIRGSGSSELPDMTGDGTPGGAFMTGFTVVPNGDIVYARADAPYNPGVANETPNGSQALPYPVLAAEAIPNSINGGNLNSVVNAGSNFNPAYDYSGSGRFEPSAFYAAQLLNQETGGPVVIIAEASIPSRDPLTGAIVQTPFVLQGPNGENGSAAIPAMTTLIFSPGTILKMENASLLVQNQGSALQILGGPNSYQTVTITSYKDSSIGGDSDNDPSATPSPGDYGGIVFRNYDQAAIPGTTAARTSTFPGQIPITNTATDNLLKGPFTSTTNPDSQTDAISGADDIMSFIGYLTEKYGGGVVPQANGIQYDGITLLNSRPTIVNSTITDAGGPGTLVAGVSVDVDSLRSDDVAKGPLLRADSFVNNGLNGIYIRAQAVSGIAEATNAIVYPNNPTSLGGSANYVLDDPYPYLLTSVLNVGVMLEQETGGNQTFSDNRLYINPGMLVKFELGAGILVHSDGSLNVGDSTYIKQFDLNNNYGPTLPSGATNPNFVTNSSQLAQVVLTSLDDDTASTSYYNPITKTTTTIVAPLPAVDGGSGTNQPTPGNVPAAAIWGSITLDSGSVDVINSADIRYGGGVTNTPTGSEDLPAVIQLAGADGSNTGTGFGANVMITNNTITDNVNAPIGAIPDAYQAGNPEEPLLSGDPFIHGNTLIRNVLDGVLIEDPTTGVNVANLDTNSVWTGGDYTFILEGTVVLGGNGLGQFDSVGNKLIGQGAGSYSNTLQPEPTAALSLTLQSTLPGTVLADGTVVPAPGVPLVVKLWNDGNAPPTSTPGVNLTASVALSDNGGAGFLVGVDNGVDPGADTLVDPGVLDSLRILGIAGDQSTGQARVPVIITSLFNNTVGTTVNGVVSNIAAPTQSTRGPAAGDGGVIFFGANSLTSYDLQDPRYGNIISNADISDMTEIEQQGGGLIYGFAIGSTSFTPTEGQYYGLPLATSAIELSDQVNQPKSLPISDSNLANFSVAALNVTPGFGSLLFATNYMQNPQIIRDTAFDGEPTHTYLVNDTISGMPGDAVQIVSALGDNGTDFPAPAEAVFLNDTFYGDGGGIHTYAATSDGINSLAQVTILVMDSIFSNITNNAIELDGQSYGSEIQYNLFYLINGQTSVTNPSNLVQTNNTNGVNNDQPVFGNPEFRSPTTGNFNLLPNSAAIDLARSELGPSIFGDMLYPAVTINNSNLAATPIRNEPGFSTVAGDVNTQGGLGNAQFAQDVVTLPGLTVTQRGFPDSWIAVLPSAGTGTSSTAMVPGTYDFQPIIQQRDQVGNQRVKDPNSTNVGFGSNPFFDLGAFEYIIQNPPVVDSVVTTSAGSTTTSNIYGVGTIGGTNKLPTSIEIQFNQQVNPATLTSSSVTLEASGGTGQFNGNASDHFYNLAGLLSFNSTTDILTINTTSIFTSTASANDEYQVVLYGTGPAVIENNAGVALDGLNLDSAGNQLALPSGADQFPGSNFYVTFSIDTHAPSLVAGTFKLDPTSDSSGGLNITNVAKPTFIGTITDIFPPSNPLIGDTVQIDVATQGNDNNFDVIDAGTGTTNATGQFAVTLNSALPPTPNPVGTNGIQGSQGGVYTLVRVRVTDLAGNTSTLLTEPFSTFLADNAVTELQEYPNNPQITAFSPLGNTVATPLANGDVQYSVTFNQNIKTSTLNANSILVYRSGGTGSFTNPVAVPIIASSLTETYSTAAATLGYETVTFDISGPLPNDQYEVVLKGTGANAITDLAGNPLSGTFSGTFPTGSINTAGDFTSGPFVVYQPSQSHLIYVQSTSSVTVTGTGVQGTRENPFPTISQGMAAASIGDDVLVLPGTYREDVTVKPGVRLLSAATSSTDTSFTPGTPDQTLIYGVTAKGGALASSGNDIITVLVSGSVAGIPTEVSGFSIISPLIGNSVTGTIDPTNVAIEAINSNVLIDHNNIITAGIGVNLAASGTAAQTSDIYDNVIAGNIYGMVLSDEGSISTVAQPFTIANNTIVYNTYGVANYVSAQNYLQAFIVNNIIAYNHDLTSARNGTGIASNQPNTLGVGFNLFYQNGANNNASSNAAGSFGMFIPGNLAATQDPLGNILGNPYFIQAEDPRPSVDTPPVFFNYADFDLTSKSIAINAANESEAPTTDFLYRLPVKIAGHGFANTGPASIGAYYPNGTSAIPITTGIPFTGSSSTTGSTGTGGNGNSGPVVGGTPAAEVPGITAASSGSSGSSSSSSGGSGSSAPSSTIGGGLPLGTAQFSVVTTSLSSNGSAHAADGLSSTVAIESGPGYIDINFSDNINASSLSPSDLLLSGNGLSSSNPATVTSMSWIDDHAVRFFITGGYASSGTVNIEIPAGAIIDSSGAPIVAFNDSFQLPTATAPTNTGPVATTAPVTPTTLLASVLPVVQPVAAASPVAAATKHAVASKVKVSTSKTKAHHVTPAKTTTEKHSAAKAVHKAAPAKPAKTAVKVAHKTTSKKK